MTLDSENGKKGQDDDLSIFEKSLKPDLFDPLKEDEGKISEIDVVRDVIAEISAEYGIKVDIQDGRELGYELALNHRLDDLDGASPIGINDEILISIQDNTISEKQATELFNNLTDIDELDFKDEKQLNLHLLNVYRVLEAVVVDPPGEFDNDIEAQSRLLTSLQAAADKVSAFINQKPQRDSEQLSAKNYLSEQIDKRMLRLKNNFLAEYPHLIPAVNKVADQVRVALSGVSDSLEESRGHLVNILKTYDKIFKVSLGKTLTYREDTKKLEDVITMISDL